MSNSLEVDCEVIVIGAGAAGLLAASRAAERGRRTVLLEKNRKPGVKILMSGGRRCNLTHATDSRGIAQAFAHQGRFLRSSLAALGPSDLVRLIEAEGVVTKIEPTGKIFPASNRAVDVQQALLRRLLRSSCRLRLDEPALRVDRDGGLFRVTTPRAILAAPRIIVTTGGRSYPACGTTGDGYGWLASLGHTIVPPRPALVPITSAASWIGELQGITLPDVQLRAVPRTAVDLVSDPSARRAACRKTALAERRGSLLLTHFGLSGPAALDLSRTVTAVQDMQSLYVVCDLLPDWSIEQLEEHVRKEACEHGGRSVARILPRELPERLTAKVVNLAGLGDDSPASQLTRTSRQQLVLLLKCLAIPVAATLGFEKAEVTAGGVSLDEVDSRTLESKIVPGLFVAGELLDLDGPIGGYNFQAAFSTGWLAGQSV